MSQTPATTQSAQLSLLDLEELEGKVRAGLKTFVEVGTALQQIRDTESYKLRGFATMAQYCAEAFGISYQQGERLIKAADTAKRIEAVTGQLPKTQAAVDALEDVASNKKTLGAVVKELKDKGKTLADATAETIKAAVRQVVAERDGNQANLIQPKPAPQKIEEPPPITIAQFSASDFCPCCGEVPANYCREGNDWKCGNCGGPVALRVDQITVQITPAS